MATQTARLPSESLVRAMRSAIQSHQSGDLKGARSLYKRALREEPTNTDALGLLATVELELGYLDEAAQLASRASALAPREAHHWCVLGRVHLAQEKTAEAETSFAQALSIDSAFAEAYLYRGELFLLQNRCAEAADTFKAAIDRGLPNDQLALAAYTNLSAALGRLNRHQECFEAAREAMRRGATSATAYYNLGNAIGKMGYAHQAVDVLRQAVDIDPTDADAWNELGGNLYIVGRTTEAAAAFNRAVGLEPLGLHARDNALLALNYWVEDPALLLREHREYDAAFQQIERIEHGPRAAARSKLRVAYLSSDLRQHSVAYFIAPLLEHYDRAAFEVYCYFTNEHADNISAEYRAHVDVWRDAHALNDDELAQRIAADEIDILIELHGHSGGARLGVCARRPAPIQMTYLGYPTTTGMSAIDYRISDRQVDPEHQDSTLANSERVLRLPHSYFCFRPRDLPPLSPLPALKNDGITFGSFNNLAKLSDRTVGLWSEVLKALPDSSLMLKARPFVDQGVQDGLRARFEKHGIARERLRLQNLEAEVAAHLSWYANVDIALDPYPYNGATTTCEALWMGVPVITLSGPTHASRMGNSILSAVGLPELVCKTPESFVEKCVALARNIERLADMRASLREVMKRSPLMDEVAFVRDFEAQLRAAWDRHVSIEA